MPPPSMAYHKKNLLEAFQASAAAEKARAAHGAGEPASKAGGPFASPAPEAPTPPAPAAAPTPRLAWRPDGLQRLVALCLVTAIAAFFLGRASVSTVGASAPDSTARVAEPTAPGESGARESRGADPAREPAAQLAAEEDTQASTPAERALFDPRNRYTVKLVEYVKGRDDAIALQTLQWLQQQGHPAVAQFQGSRLYIFMGAAATQDGLDGQLRIAKTMNGPPPLNKPAEFNDAYIVNIDKMIQR